MGGMVPVSNFRIWFGWWSAELAVDQGYLSIDGFARVFEALEREVM